ncbi:MAG: hypothetical protein LQ338_006082 [Usnochroma carphineum]|nr:MAG: hypothetical protein LQ338_006082 [Usnochroma carphineum]
MSGFVGLTGSQLPSREEYMELQDELGDTKKELANTKEIIKGLRRELRQRDSSVAPAAQSQELAQSYAQAQALRTENSRLRAVIGQYRRKTSTFQQALREAWVGLSQDELEVPLPAEDAGTALDEGNNTAEQTPETKTYGIPGGDNLLRDKPLGSNPPEVGALSIQHGWIPGFPQGETLFGSHRGDASQLLSLYGQGRRSDSPPGSAVPFRGSGQTFNSEYNYDNRPTLPSLPTGAALLHPSVTQSKDPGHISASQVFKQGRGRGGRGRGRGRLPRGNLISAGASYQQEAEQAGTSSEPRLNEPTLTTAESTAANRRTDRMENQQEGPPPQQGLQMMSIHAPQNSPAGPTVKSRLPQQGARETTKAQTDTPSGTGPGTTISYGPGTLSRAPSFLTMTSGGAPSNYTAVAASSRPYFVKGEPDSDPDEAELVRRLEERDKNEEAGDVSHQPEPLGDEGGHQHAHRAHAVDVTPASLALGISSTLEIEGASSKRGISCVQQEPGIGHKELGKPAHETDQHSGSQRKPSAVESGSWAEDGDSIEADSGHLVKKMRIK